MNYAKIMNHDEISHLAKTDTKMNVYCYLIIIIIQWFLNSLKLKLPFLIANVLKLHFLDSFKTEIAGIWEKYENF